jgi:hypothetical protein
MTRTNVGYTTEEIRLSEPTRAARLKWVIVVDAAAPLGQQVNAAACIAASTSAAISGILGPDAVDADGTAVAGLPWAGCTILAAPAEQLAAIAAKAESTDGMFVSVMPLAAQTNRVYDEYRSELARTAGTDRALVGISVVGARNAVDRLVKRLSLLG